MKRLVLVIALCLLVLAAAATPALAWYAPQERTAYIDGYFQPKGWLEWAGPDDPLSLVVHRGDPIPAGWPVYVCVSWVDFKYAGAVQVPSRMFNEAAFARDGGGWTWEAIGPRTPVDGGVRRCHHESCSLQCLCTVAQRRGQWSW